MAKKSFEDWMEAISADLWRAFGITVEDLPDCDYWEMWDSGFTPARAASFAIKNAGGF